MIYLIQDAYIDENEKKLMALKLYNSNKTLINKKRYEN